MSSHSTNKLAAIKFAVKSERTHPRRGISRMTSRKRVVFVGGRSNNGPTEMSISGKNLVINLVKFDVMIA